MSVTAILDIIMKATKSVPFVKYALGLAGVVSLIALIKSFKISWQVGLWGTIIVLCLMLVLFLLSRAAVEKSENTKGTHWPTQTLVWAISLLFVSTVFFLVTCVFFNWPKNPALLLAGVGKNEKDYLFYLFDGNSRLPFTLPKGKLQLWIGDESYDGIKIGEGKYTFLKASAVIDSKVETKMMLLEQKKYTFSNFAQIISVKMDSSKLFIMKDTNYLKLKVTLRYNDSPFVGASLVIAGTGYNGHTNGNGVAIIPLPQTEERETFQVFVTKGTISKTVNATLQETNEYNVADLP